MSTPEPEKGAAASAESRDDDARKQPLRWEPSFSRWCDEDQVNLASRSESRDSSSSAGDESDNFQLPLLKDGSRSGPPDGQRITYFRQQSSAVDGRRYATFSVENGLHPNNPAAHAASGVLATVASDTVINLMDTVKQRLQLSSSPYNGVADCVRRVLREEVMNARRCILRRMRPRIGG